MRHITHIQGDCRMDTSQSMHETPQNARSRKRESGKRRMEKGCKEKEKMDENGGKGGKWRKMEENG